METIVHYDVRLNLEVFGNIVAEGRLLLLVSLASVTCCKTGRYEEVPPISTVTVGPHETAVSQYSKYQKTRVQNDLLAFIICDMSKGYRVCPNRGFLSV